MGELELDPGTGRWQTTHVTKDPISSVMVMAFDVQLLAEWQLAVSNLALHRIIKASGD